MNSLSSLSINALSWEFLQLSYLLSEYLFCSLFKHGNKLKVKARKENDETADLESELIEIICIQIAHTWSSFSVYCSREKYDEKNFWLELNHETQSRLDTGTLCFFPYLTCRKGLSAETQHIIQPNKTFRNKFNRTTTCPKSTVGSHLTDLNFSKRFGKHPSVKILSTTFSIGFSVVVGVDCVEVLLGKHSEVLNGTVEFAGTVLLERQLIGVVFTGG